MTVNSLILSDHHAFQVLAFIGFITHISFTIDAYLRYNVVRQHSSAIFDSIKKPMIYVCLENQFSYEKANAEGYLDKTEFLKGQTKTGQVLNWNGVNNKSYEELVSTIFETRNQSLSFRNTKAKEIFIMPHGNCFELTDFDMNDQLYVWTQRMR